MRGCPLDAPGGIVGASKPDLCYRCRTRYRQAHMSGCCTQCYQNHWQTSGDLKAAEIEAIIRREAERKRQTGWRPEGWHYWQVRS